jgi:hypothetical protein
VGSRASCAGRPDRSAAKDPPIAPDSAEPFPLSVTFAAMAIVAVPLVAVGLTLRWVHDRRALEGL